MKKSLLALIFLVLCSSLFAQAPPMQWGAIPPEHLAMSVYEKDSSATAVVLCNYAELFLDQYRGEYTFDFHKRIKLLKRSAFKEYGNIKIYEWYNDRVSKIKAQVILPNGKIIPLNKKDIFEEKISDNYTSYNFSFPQLEEGAIIEYSYRLKSEAFVSLETWYFQHSIPTLWSEYRLEIPASCNYVILKKGPKMHLSESKPKKRNSNINIHRYVHKDLPALQEESFITTMKDYRASVQFQLHYVIDGYGVPIYYMSDWNKLAEKLSKNKNFGIPISKKHYIKKILKNTDPLMSGIQDNDEKVQVLYDFMSETMEWNGRESTRLLKPFKESYAEKAASSGELNLMFIALLRHYDIEAYPVMLSTRDHGQMIQIYPILNQFNHTLAYVKLNNRFICVDIDAAYRPLGYPRINSLNGYGWLVDKDRSRWIELPRPEGKQISSGTLQLLKDGSIEGKMDYRFTGYASIEFNQEKAENEELSFLKKGLADLFPDATFANPTSEQRNDTIVEASMSVNIPNAAQVIDDMIYLTPTILPDFEENPLKLEERTYPVDLAYPITYDIVHFISMPEGYKVDELPESVRMKLANKGARFHYSVKQINEKSLQVVSKLTINQSTFSPEEYPALRNFFDLVVEKQAEQIVLRKVNTPEEKQLISNH